MALRAASRSGLGYLLWASDSLAVGDGHERALVLLLVLLAGVVGGAFAGILVLLPLALEAVEDHSDRLLTQGMATGNVEDLLGGSWALMS